MLFQREPRKESQTGRLRESDRISSSHGCGMASEVLRTPPLRRGNGPGPHGVKSGMEEVLQATGVRRLYEAVQHPDAFAESAPVLDASL